MVKISREDRLLLQVLVQEGRLEKAEAQDLLQSLELHQMKNPRLRVTDLLVKKEILTVSELENYLADLAEEEAPQRSAAPPRRAAAGRAAPSRGASKRVVEVAQEEPRNSMGPLIFAGAVVLVLSGVATFLWLQKSQEPEPSQQQEQARSETVEVEEAEESPFSDSSLPEVDPVSTDPVERQLRKKLQACLRIEDPRQRVDELKDMLMESRGEVVEDILAALSKAEEEYSGVVREAYGKVESKVERHLDREEYPQAIALLEDLLDEYGLGAMDGELQGMRDTAKRDLDDYCGKQLRKATKAYDRKDYLEAKAIFERVAASGIARHAKSANKWLGMVEGKLAGRDGSDEEVVASSAGEPKPASARDPEHIADSGAGNGASDDSEVDVEEHSPNPDDDRITKIAARIQELFPSRKATLDSNGILSVTYNLSNKDIYDGLDWGPDIERAKPGEPVRWTVRREDDRFKPGVRIADRGLWTHKAKLQAPIKFDAEYYCQNHFSASNLVALAWINEKGNGAGTNYGYQTGYVKKGRVGKLKGRVQEISATTVVKIGLDITEDEFLGRHGRSQTATRALKEKGMTSGFLAISWANRIVGTLMKVTISGKLDLDWAEEELGL